MKTPNSPNIEHAAPRGLPTQQEIARELVANSDVIRSMVEARFNRGGSRVDTTDVVQSLIRRVDAAVQRKTFTPQSMEQVWGFVATAVKLVGYESLAARKRLVALGDDDGEWIAMMDKRTSTIVHDEDMTQFLYDCLSALPELDRDLMLVLLRGASITVAAQAVGITPEYGRKRLQLVRERLRERFGERHEQR